MSHHCYELRSINLGSLSDDEAQAVIARFASFLHSLSDPISFRIIEDRRDVRAGNVMYQDRPYKRYFIESPTEIDGPVSIIGTKWFRIPSIPRLEIKRARDTFLLDSENHFVRVYNVTSLGSGIRPGFISTVQELCHEIRIEIEPIENLKAKEIASGHLYFLYDRIKAQQEIVGATISQEYSRTQQILKEVVSSRERLFKVRMNAVLRAPNYESLKKKTKLLLQVLGGIVEEVSSPMWLQLPLYSGEGPKWTTGRFFFVPTSSLISFFPFSGLDLVDPLGTFVGENVDTGNVILYDLYEKSNYNVAIMGATGSGKSMLIKSFASRMAIENPDVFMFVFDSLKDPEYSIGPDGSYENSFAGLIGAHVHRISRGERAGLDPFHIFEDRRQASSFISGLLNEKKEPDLRRDLNEACDVSNSIEDLLSNSKGELLSQLESDLKPYMPLFLGEPIEIKQRMVFSLKDMPAWIQDTATFLVFSYVWARIKEMQKSVKKMVVVDEGWTLVGVGSGQKMPLASDYVPEIARTGRHHNCAFILSMQLASDFLEKGIGRTVIGSCDTKFILKQESPEADSFQKEFKLDDSERQYVVSCPQGFGLLLTSEGRLKFKNVLSDYERGLFTTKPEDRKA